jgi:adenosylcobinamide-GDP ribazoletransferase
MKTWLHAFFMAWGMFLAVPCPYKKWDEKALDKMLVFLPAIGLIVGGVWALAAYLTSLLGYPRAGLTAAILMAVPWIVTGFIHLDGFMDVCDAVLSRRDLETRQRILKDPHCGAFAVISLGLLMLASFAVLLSWEYDAVKLIPLALIPAATRASAGIAVLGFKPMSTSQYSRERDKRLIFPLAVLLAAAISVPVILYGLSGLAPASAAAAYWLFALYGRKQLGGMNGDISGFALTLGELVGIIILVFVR